MNSMITMMNNSDNHSFLSSRMKAFSIRYRRQAARRSISFRAPKEMTTKLLRFHAQDDHSDENFQRRKRSLRCQRKKQHSFCLPSDHTKVLLSEHFVEDLDAKEHAQKTSEIVSKMTSIQVDSPKCTRETPRRNINKNFLQYKISSDETLKTLPPKEQGKLGSFSGVPITTRRPMARRSSQTACTA